MMNDAVDDGHSQELTAKEYEELESFLIDESALSDPMNLDVLDGFLTALLIGPETVMPSEWLALVWSPYGKPESPAFKSVKQAERIIGLIMRMMNSILYNLEERPDEYVPLPFLLLFDDDKQRLLSARFWCLGFILGVNLRHSSWDPLLNDEEAEASFFMISRVAGVLSDTIDEDDDEALEFWEVVAELVLEIKEFWMSWRQRAMEGLRQARPVAPGRNNPYPCGSGKKYKQCCGK